MKAWVKLVAFSSMGELLGPGTKPYTPVEVGLFPNKRLLRDGLHKGDWQWALTKSVPLLARRSMLGVFTSGWPFMQAIQSFWSSIEMKRTLGLLTSRLMPGCKSVKIREKYAGMIITRYSLKISEHHPC